MEVKFRTNEGIEGIAVNPGDWFGKVWIIQIAIANALNPCFAIEAGSEQDAIDEFADSRFSHLIDCECECGDEECDCCRCGNDGHPVNLDNVSIRKPGGVVYFVEWKPSDDIDILAFNEAFRGCE